MNKKKLLTNNLKCNDIDSLNNKENESLFTRLFNRLVLNKKKKTNSDNSSNVVEQLPSDTIRYNPDVEKGLSTEEVSERISKKLTNKDLNDHSRTYTQIFFKNIFTFFNILEFIIFVALIICQHFMQTTFFIVVAINTIIGIYQEIKSKKTIDKLKLVNKQNITVTRNGKKESISTDDLVLDDVYSLSTGDQIPTDAILLSGHIEVNESLLTGESLPIKKDVGDLILAGSFVVSGTASVRADKVSKYNYANGIQAKAKVHTEKKSELITSLNMIIKAVSFIIIPLAIGLFLSQWYRYAESPEAYGISATLKDDGAWKFYYEVTRLDVSKTAGSLVGMIPSGIFLLTSVALAASAFKLSKRNTLVQDLYCIEMLARVNVLCLDKTGTLTDGTMKVNEVKQIDSSYDINILMGSFLNSFEESNQTSNALKDYFKLNNSYQPKTILPFSSKRKLSAVTFNADVGTFILGAPEYVYPDYQKDENLYSFIKNAQSDGLRIIMLAKSSLEIENDDLSPDSKIEPVCVFSLEDHIREEAPSTINWFINNDVDIKIISGDDPLTASIIATKCNVPNANKYISLKDMSLDEVRKIVFNYTVFGRVSPEQKALIIESLKAKGKTVGMTGDGVNDILAMKSSDCSIAMANGSNAAKNVANLVLLDSNFASMPSVVKEGRKVVNNISRSSSLFLMKTLFVAAFTMICCVFAQFPYPFTTNNILVFEVVGIGIPSLFLSLQPNDQIIKGSFLRKTFANAIPSALCLLIAVLFNYILKYTHLIPMYSFENVEQSIQSNINNYAFTTFNVLTMNVIALIMVFERCRPFNRYRRNLYIFLCCVSVLITFVLPYIPAPGKSKNPLYGQMSDILGFNTYNLSIKITGTDFRMMNRYMWYILLFHFIVIPFLYFAFCLLFSKLDNSEKVNKPLILSIKK